MASRSVCCRAGRSRAPPVELQQPSAQAVQQRRRRQHLHPGRRQLDRQRQPVQPRQTSATAAAFCVGEGEVGANGLRALGRRGQPRRRGSRRPGWRPCSAERAAAPGARARPEGAAAPGWWPAPGRPGRRRAGRRPAQPRSRGDARSCRGAAAAGAGRSAAASCLGERPHRPTRRPRAPGDGRQHQRRVGQRREVDEGDAVGEGVGDVLGDGQGQPRLAHPAGPGQGQQGDGLVQQQGTRGGALGLPADEPGARDGRRSEAGGSRQMQPCVAPRRTGDGQAAWRLDGKTSRQRSVRRDRRARADSR